MNEWLPAAGALVAGLLLGLVFFWGLWLTVAGLERSPRPALRLLISGLLRFGLVASVLVLLARYGGWLELLCAALGFTLARFIMVRRLFPDQGDAGRDA
jgi:F1F0 ATPase subunit 2